MQSTNRVRKKYFLLLAICLLAVGLAACGKTNASEKDEESRSARSHRTNIEEESAANGEDD